MKLTEKKNKNKNHSDGKNADRESLVESIAGGLPGFTTAQIAPTNKVPTSTEDKITVARARKVQKFLSQPFSVAEQFTGMQGKYVPLKETIRGFKEIVEGKHDDLPESAFLFAGTIDEVIEKANKGE